MLTNSNTPGRGGTDVNDLSTAEPFHPWLASCRLAEPQSRTCHRGPHAWPQDRPCIADENASRPGMSPQRLPEMDHADEQAASRVYPRGHECRLGHATRLSG